MDEFPRTRPRQAARWCALAALLLAGCETLGVTPKVKNPVVPPPPRRVLEPADDVGFSGGEGDGVVLAEARANDPGWKSNPSGRQELLTAWQSSTETEATPEAIRSGEVAATVNGVPIFVDDVLMPFAPALERAEKAMPPEDFAQQKRMLVAKLLKTHIEQELLLQALKEKINKPEQLEQIQKHIDQQFDEDLKDTMKKQGVSTVGEFQVKLRKMGSSIEDLRTTYRNRRLAQQYLSMRALPQEGFDRPDLLAYYQEHLEDYAVPGQVRWRQVQLSFAKHGGKEQARKLAGELMARLEEGEDFAKLAREHSDGPTASAGGVWDWTTQGSLAARELDQMLFEMPARDAGALVESADAIDIVSVIERRDAGHKPFEEVQNEIKESIRKTSFQSSVEDLLAELAEKSTIENYVDDK